MMVVTRSDVESSYQVDGYTSPISTAVSERLLAGLPHYQCSLHNAILQAPAFTFYTASSLTRIVGFITTLKTDIWLPVFSTYSVSSFRVLFSRQWDHNLSLPSWKTATILHFPSI